MVAAAQPVLLGPLPPRRRFPGVGLCRGAGQASPRLPQSPPDSTRGCVGVGASVSELEKAHGDVGQVCATCSVANLALLGFQGDPGPSGPPGPPGEDGDRVRTGRPHRTRRPLSEPGRRSACGTLVGGRDTACGEWARQTGPEGGVGAQSPDKSKWQMFTFILPAGLGVRSRSASPPGTGIRDAGRRGVSRWRGAELGGGGI